MPDIARMKYLGFQNDVEYPFKKGQEVVIPAGVVVKSTNPQKKEWITVRSQTVKVNHIICGLEVDEYHFKRYRQNQTPVHSYDRFLDQENKVGFLGRWYILENPQVTWAGSGKYWCSVDINDILEANGIEV